MTRLHIPVLASSSIYRRQLLSRLYPHFEAVSPDIDESRHHNESVENMVERLSLEKAQAVGPRFPANFIIGSDQVAVLGQQIFGKPGDHETASAQLQQLSGQTVVFHTGLCLLNAATGKHQITRVPCEVRFKHLNPTQIERYLRRDKPYHCAGSFQSESLGIVLVDSIRCDDPTALMGLPLIALVAMLHQEGIDPLE